MDEVDVVVVRNFVGAGKHNLKHGEPYVILFQGTDEQAWIGVELYEVRRVAEFFKEKDAVQYAKMLKYLWLNK